ncbi:RadC family protein [Paucilactobacillus nenjiangensis]|uniref:RadC family protein n=1 Tax=Paucilactobacillus nenjiangensis TaxID=1296540 RepID=UPI0010F80386|nr:DNA repair protein RadC [Paucilactobacillus nenjiangensis]
MIMSELTDQELLIKFFSNSEQNRVGELASNFWRTFPTLTDFKIAKRQSKTDLIESDTQYQQLLVGIELGQRIAHQSRPVIGKIYSSQQIGLELVEQLRDDVQECLVLFCLDVKHQIVAQQVVFKGTLSSCPVHPREIFALALEHRAESILVAHNHPSGSVEPSQNDILFSKRLDQCGDLMGVELLDSFIIGDGDYLSLREADLFD